MGMTWLMFSSSAMSHIFDWVSGVRGTSQWAHFLVAKGYLHTSSLYATGPCDLYWAKERKWSLSVVSDSLQPCGLRPAKLLCPWDFPWPEYWSVLLFPSPEDLPNPGIELGSPTLQTNSLLSEPQGTPMLGKAEIILYFIKIHY